MRVELCSVLLIILALILGKMLCNKIYKVNESFLTCSDDPDCNTCMVDSIRKGIFCKEKGKWGLDKDSIIDPEAWSNRESKCRNFNQFPFAQAK